MQFGQQSKGKEEVLPTITSMCTYNVGGREGRSSRVNYEQPQNIIDADAIIGRGEEGEVPEPNAHFVQE